MTTNRRVVPKNSIRNAPKDGADFYPTPPWATRALLAYESFDGTILEPCCGDGAMAKVFVEAGYTVDASDLHDRGYGTQKSFFDITTPQDNIVTNPPFNIAEEILSHGLSLIRGKMALFLRTAFVESVGRYHRVYSVHPPSRIYAFAKRVSLYPAGEKTSGGTTSYSWFIWEREKPVRTEMLWIAPDAGEQKPGLFD